MYYNIKGYIDDIDNFEQAGTGKNLLRKDMIDKRILEISINEHELTKRQIDNIKRSMDYAKEKKVELKFIIEKQEEKMDVVVIISKEKKQKILEWL